MTPLMISALGLLMVATAFLSGLFGMAGGLILIGVLLNPDAAAVGDGAACDHADGVEWLARLAVAQPHQMAAGRDLSDRMRGRAGGMVDHPLCAGQADGAFVAGGDAVHGAADAVQPEARPREHLAGHLLRLDLHGADADDRRLRSADGQLLSRRQIRSPRHRRDQGHLPGRQSFREAGLFRRHHRSGRQPRSGSRRLSPWWRR